MKGIVCLIKKAGRTIINEGWKSTLTKTKVYLKRKKNTSITPNSINEKQEAEKYYMDVLFINGCTIPHPSRYRVSHQREELLAGNMTSSEILYTDLKLDLVNQYRVFVFYRCPYTRLIGEFIQLAKYYNKKVYYDTDDLVIDKMYTDPITYIKQMSKQEKDIYDEGVRLNQKTLKMCDGAITTTEALANELKKYVPDVFINRNVASERMVQLSEQAVSEKISKISKESKKNNKRKIRLGYFSGSITHNSDLALILPAIKKIMRKYTNIELFFAGDIDIPGSLKPFSKRIVVSKYVNWEKLPELIASVDINLAPLENTLFNSAKSENKWMEASLVKVPTIASDVGAFNRMIIQGETGILCSNEKEWYEQIENLVLHENIRIRIAENAYKYVIENCTTISKGYQFAKQIKNRMNANIVFVLPNLQISGGMQVVLKHCTILKNTGLDVSIISEGYEKKINICKEGIKIPVINKNFLGILGSIDKAVATLWSTVDFITLYPNINKRYYLVQGMETNFHRSGEYLRFRANQTYNSCINIKYLTVSQWCQKWLKEKFDRDVLYAPNGLDLKRFKFRQRSFEGKIRILIEGNSDDFYKNVDESFKIAEILDKEKYEIWYMSYQGKPKDWYYVDKFFHKVPYEEVPAIYQDCDILVKSSILESFSYPPLEMMATGGICVVTPNGGNEEYLEDSYNCLFYASGAVDQAIEKIKLLSENEAIRNKLIENGMATAKSRDWNALIDRIQNLYN